MSNRIELEKSFVLDEENEKRIQEKIKQEGFNLISEEVEEDTYFSDQELNFVKNRVCLRTRKINDDYFIMPEEDVTIRAVWSKLSLTKSVPTVIITIPD